MDDICHCGAEFDGSDHCPACYCEQYESTCDHVYDYVADSEWVALTYEEV